MSNLRIDLDRLMDRIQRLGQVGALEGGGVCRLALTGEDKAGRDLVVGWMRELGLQVTVDRIGNVVGLRPGETDGPPVMTGSHIDTVATGGLYDGNLGVLAGLEVVESLNDAGVTTRHPLAVGFFTNEEGARFAPDMMGSGVHQGALSLDDCLATRGIDGTMVGDDLAQIGYAGEAPVGGFRAKAFFELHVEQGPVLEEEGVEIGAVTGVQGISWTEYTIAGTSNHAGTTPMRLRHDAGYVAAAIATTARQIARDMGGDQVATVGVIELEPNLVNVIARRAKVTVDLRNTDEAKLQQAEGMMAEKLRELAQAEGVEITARPLARFEPVDFDPEMIDLVAETAAGLGCSVKRMPSGAGHDAQMFAPNCPTAMIFVPSKDGISHNVREYTAPAEIAAGANVLLQVMLSAASH
ncbi:Zn-dependent hydrolase [Pelagibius marinus]|uniref:Zn-dependent hydrolase n=1 Tax=Pelagibius marinus TaxID=2762760 RepID=UPI001872F8F7|nr:Zn-dependent hydrolase [Pelagibius marinus]